MSPGLIKTFVLTVCLGFFVFNQGHSQAGLNVYTGISAAFSPDKNITPNGMGHYGFFVGADARLFSGGMYFAGGLKYYRTSLLAENSMTFFSNIENYNFLSARFGLGFTLKQLSYRSSLRSKLFGTFNFAGNNPVNMIDVPGYEKLNDSSAGLVTGLGADIGFFTLDLEYEFGLVNAFRDQPDSKYNILSFAVGFVF